MIVGAGDPLVRWDWVSDNAGRILDATIEHLVLTLAAVAIGFVISLPVSLAAHRWRWLLGPTLVLAGVLYTIPSLAAFALLVPYTGLTMTTAVIPLAAYTLFVLVRATVTGLADVPAAVTDAADGMGYRRRSRVWTVEVPLALPAIMSGLRLATVSTIGLVTITSLITYGGLGRFIQDGFRRDFNTPIVVGAALSILLAVAADLGLAALGRSLTPWTRAGASS